VDRTAGRDVEIGAARAHDSTTNSEQRPPSPSTGITAHEKRSATVYPVAIGNVCEQAMTHGRDSWS
jgi:hypothetical protein